MRLSSRARIRTCFLYRLPIIRGLWGAMINWPFSARMFSCSSFRSRRSTPGWGRVGFVEEVQRLVVLREP
jgi:hypothetical protein